MGFYIETINIDCALRESEWLGRSKDARFIVRDDETKQILANGSGYGYKTYQKAVLAYYRWKYSSTRRKEKQREQRTVYDWSVENAKFVETIDRVAAHHMKHGRRLNARVIEKLFISYGKTCPTTYRRFITAYDNNFYEKEVLKRAHREAKFQRIRNLRIKKYKTGDNSLDHLELTFGQVLMEIVKEILPLHLFQHRYEFIDPNEEDETRDWTEEKKPKKSIWDYRGVVTITDTGSVLVKDDIPEEEELFVLEDDDYDEYDEEDDVETEPETEETIAVVEEPVAVVEEPEESIQETYIKEQELPEATNDTVIHEDIQIEKPVERPVVQEEPAVVNVERIERKAMIEKPAPKIPEKIIDDILGDTGDKFSMEAPIRGFSLDFDESVIITTPKKNPKPKIQKPKPIIEPEEKLEIKSKKFSMLGKSFNFQDVKQSLKDRAMDFVESMCQPFVDDYEYDEEETD